MPDRKDDLRVLEGEVSETPSSDTAILRDFIQQESEYYALTGRKITVTPIEEVTSDRTQILKPGNFTTQTTQPEDKVLSDPLEPKSIHIESLSYLHSRMALRIRNRRAEKLHTGEEKAA